MKHQSERHIIIAIMMQESSDIFLAGGDALVYLAKPLLNKYSTAFVWAIHLVRTYVMTNFSTHLHHLHDFTSFPQLRTYLMNGLFLNRKNK